MLRAADACNRIVRRPRVVYEQHPAVMQFASVYIDPICHLYNSREEFRELWNLLSPIEWRTRADAPKIRKLQGDRRRDRVLCCR